MGNAREALEAVLGAECVREADERDAVDRALPRWVARVNGTEQAAAAMRVGAEHGLRVVPKGSGSKLAWGNEPSAVDLVLDLSAANEILEHAAGDLVLRARAGTPLADVHRALGAEGQQLAIDQPLPSATLGGVIATATSGPGRYFFGGVRDLLIGITVVLADGTVATSGGKVVKNVAGYDLGRLYTGSYGTLGVITEAVFRLHPLAVEHRWLSIPTDSLAEVLKTVRLSQAMPTAIEVDRPSTGAPSTVCVQLEGRPDVTSARVRELADTVTSVTGDRPEFLDSAPDWWGRLPFDPTSGIGLRIGVRPAAIPELLTSLERSELPLAVRGSAGLGVVHAGLPGDADPDAVSRLVSSLRTEDTYAVLESAPRELRAILDPWGPVDPGVLALLRRTKNQFDPEHRLAPGRFLGGI